MELFRNRRRKATQQTRPWTTHRLVDEVREFQLYSLLDAHLPRDGLETHLLFQGSDPSAEANDQENDAGEEKVGEENKERLQMYSKLLRMRRKLQIRKTHRDNGRPVFDLDAEVYSVLSHSKKKPLSLRELYRERKVGRPPKHKGEPATKSALEAPSERFSSPKNNTHPSNITVVENETEPAADTINQRIGFPLQSENEASAHSGLDRYQQRYQRYALPFMNGTQLEPHETKTYSQRVAAAHVAFLPPKSVSYRILMMGSWDQEMNHSFTSPYTLKVLPPYIYRDDETQTPHMRLLDEILRVAASTSVSSNLYRPIRGSIDYCFMRYFHVNQVNQLLCQNFWPGIDMTEVLEYPDYSVVVCFKKLVIGCGFIRPSGYISFLLVHPQWRSTGIASTILYLLIRQCPNRDITLHVSARSSAMILYQKFGFKPEEYIVNYYHKYYPDDSPECRHALYLRLRR